MGRFRAAPAKLVDGPVSKEEKKKRDTIVKGDMKVEVKTLERRYDNKGNQYVVEQKPSSIVAEKIDWWQKFALCLTHQLDGRNDKTLSTTLQINSQVLKDLLKDVIGNFPGVSFLTKNISVTLPARSLFHYRAEIEEAGNQFSEDPDATAHIRLLLDFIDEQFEETVAETENLVEQGLISFHTLWTLFRLGILVYARVLGQPRVFRLNSYQYSTTRCGDYLQLSVSYVDYDGEQFGTRDTCLKITEFTGAERITDFNVYPLSFHPNSDELKSTLTSRGRAFESLAGQNFQRYKGIALQLGCPIIRYSVDGRVMIDCQTFHRLNADSAFDVDAFPEADLDPSAKRRKIRDTNDQTSSELIPISQSRLPRLSDERCLLTNAIVRGFSFSEKKFLDFFVDKLSPVDWNLDCFDQLVLPDAQKDLVRALVATHTSAGLNGFDDIVKGKGKGLILVLHGPPGVGKTLTAECVAEFSKRPLYIVSSGDLGTHSESLDSRLSRIMDMASTWKAVLLIDEADVFLEERSSHDIERNSLVSIFLRVLEYYEGILFLTTNRVSTFDEAFKSRIHVPLKYAQLPRESRKRIWINLLGKVDGGVDIDDDGYERLSESELNGRQVKNVVRTAGSLAKFNDKKLDLEQLLQVVTIQMQFERDLAAVGGGVDGLATPASSDK